MSRVLLSPGPHQAFPGPHGRPLRNRLLSASVQSLPEAGHLAASLMPRGRHRSEAVDVDRGQLVYPSLKDCPVVMDLHELSPVGRRATGGREGRWFEWFAEVCQGLTSRGRSHPGLLPLANLRFEVSRLLPAVSSAPDVAAAGGARKWKLLPHPRHQFRPRNP